MSAEVAAAASVPMDPLPNPGRAARVGRAGIRIAAALWLAVAAQGQEPPLPTVAAVLEGMARRKGMDAEDDRLFESRHAFTRKRLREERSVDGALRSAREERWEHPRTETADADARSEKSAGTEAEAPPGQPRGRAYERRDITLTKDIVQRFEWRVVGRELWEGRPCLRVDFGPRAGELPVNTLLDRFINHSAGTLWLEEPEYRLVRIQFRLLEKVRFVGGLVGAVYSLEGRIERQPGPAGGWYTRATDWRIDYREFFARKLVRFQEHRDQVRPLVPGTNVSTNATPSP